VLQLFNPFENECGLKKYITITLTVIICFQVTTNLFFQFYLQINIEYIIILKCMSDSQFIVFYY